jgi:hypothetical protein
MTASVRKPLLLAAVLFVHGADGSAASWPAWDLRGWTRATDGKSALELTEENKALKVRYRLSGPGWGWAEIGRELENWDPNIPFTFELKADARGHLEVKWADADGSTFLAKYLLDGRYQDWTRVTLYPLHMEYVWGGDDKPGAPKFFRLAFSGETGGGIAYVRNAGPGRPGQPETPSPFSPQIDPRADEPGLGFEKRRDARLTPEDPAVLEWLKAAQDASSPDKALLASMGDDVAQTFNNALAALAFLLKGERARAERILDFFAGAVLPENREPARQAFYYNGEPRGFFQNVVLPSEPGGAYVAMDGSDRWMGDMAWLLIAYEYHARKHGPRRYRAVRDLLLKQHKDYFKDLGDRGYVQHGWRNMDEQLHEPFGHGEINVDAYAVFRLCGETPLAEKVERWLKDELKGNSLPLDLYTWRVLSLGPAHAAAMSVPERDLRYRKTLAVRGDPVRQTGTAPSGGRKVTGFIDRAQPFVENLWLDGLGHAACAYFSLGEDERGNFYANQYDALLVPQALGGKSLPYTVNKQGGYDWVDLDQGFVSVACWYIFAKNRFNPMRLETH